MQVQNKIYCGRSLYRGSAECTQPPTVSLCRGEVSLGQALLNILEMVLQENIHTHTHTLPQAALCIHRKMGGVENSNQPEFFSWRNSHEYNRDILWDSCPKEFKCQCWYLLVVVWPFLLSHLSRWLSRSQELSQVFARLLQGRGDYLCSPVDKRFVSSYSKVWDLS